jgi:hypothetical protein
MLRQVFQVEEASPELGRFPQHVPLQAQRTLGPTPDASRASRTPPEPVRAGGPHRRRSIRPRCYAETELLSGCLGLGEEHVVAAPLQHLGRSRLTVRAHVNPRCCRRSLRRSVCLSISVMPSSRQFPPRSFRAPRSWDVCVGRPTGTDHLTARWCSWRHPRVGDVRRRLGSRQRGWAGHGPDIGRRGPEARRPTSCAMR